MQEAPLHSDSLDLLLGPAGEDASGEEGLTASALQEYLHKVDIRREEVLLTLYATVAEHFAAATEGKEEEAAAGDAGAATCTTADGGVTDADAAFSAALARLAEQAELVVEDGGTAAGLAGLAAQHAAVLAAARETAAAAASVRVAAELQQRLADFDAAVAAGSYSEAAWVAVELQKAVEAVPGSDDTATAVSARVQPLQQQLLEGVAGLWAPDPSTRVPALLAMQAAQQQGAQQATAKDARATAATLAEVWRGLEVLGLLPQALDQLARRFLEQSVQPILAAELAPSRVLSDSPAGSVASSNLSRATAAGGGRGGSSVERQLYKALKALAEQVLCGNQELAEQLGPLLWPAFAAAYIATKLKPIQPQSDAEVELYSRKSSLGAKLEQKAVALHLLPAERDGPITRHIKRALNLFLNARRNRFIAAARDLLTSVAAQEAVTVGVPRSVGTAAAPDSLPGGPDRPQAQRAPSGDGGNGAPLEGEDPLLACGEYAISKAAQGAVSLMRDALAEAVQSGNTALAQAMCGAVVDVAAMVVALPPPGAAANSGSSSAGSLPQHPAEAAAARGEIQRQQQQQALLLPYPAALRHNDCHHVYQALCNLPYQFSPRLQLLVHRNVNFINPAQRVRRAGQDCLQAMVQQQQQELLGLAADLRHFAGLDADGQAGIRYRKTVQQLLHSFRRLGAVLRPVLAPGVFVEVAAQLVQAVCQQVMDDIMSLPDISVDESEQIPRILEPLTAGLHDAVLPPPLSLAQRAERGDDAAAAAAEEEAAWAAAAVGGVRLDDLTTALHERTPAVMKLRELCELLDIRLVEIRQRWQDGRLQAIGFSAEEVVHLVCALFEDTDLRRDFLGLLESEAEGAALL